MLKVTKSGHNQDCIQIENPTEEQRNIIRSTILNNYTDSIEYKLSQQAGAFLQCDYEDYILVEFWTNNFIPFVVFLNSNKAFTN